MEIETAWIQKALTGDQQAFECLVEAYQTPVFNLSYRMLGDPAEAEDAAQETFVRAYTRLRTFQLDRKFSSWILSIASHYCIDCLRRRRTSQVPLEDLLAQKEFADPYEGPEKRTLNMQDREMIRRLMTGLPEQYRVVLALRYWNELSYEEMANVLNATESAVKSRLHRARRMLAEQITESEQGFQAEQDRFGATGISAPAPNREKEALQNALSSSH